MERIHQLLRHVASQLAVLTVSQRVAIGLCAALAAVSLAWLVKWSGTAEYVPLVYVNLAPEELAVAERELQSHGADYKVRHSRLHVRAGEQYQWMRLLNAARVLPAESMFDMETMVADTSPFLSPEAREYAQNYARGNTLARMLASSPDVDRAQVIINPQRQRRLGGAATLPTASVLVAMARGRELDAESVEWIARQVAGAVAGLEAYHVQVSDGRRSFNVPHPDESAHMGYLGERKKRETHLRQKVQQTLAYIPGVIVDISVELDTDRRTQTNIRYQPPQPRLEKRNETSSQSGGSAAEPGIQANLGVAITADGGSGRTSSEEESTEYFDGKPTEQETVERGRLATRAVTAAVSIPRSFVAGLYTRKNPTVTEPTDEQLVEEQTALVSRVSRSVAGIIMARDPEDVTVDVYPDLVFGTEGAEWSSVPGHIAGIGPQPEGVDTMGLLIRYGPQAGLGLMALLSLMLMARVARRGVEMLPHGSGFGPTGRSDETTLDAGSATVGQATASESFLTGVELGEEAIKYKQISEEVSRMVDEDPLNAAQLIRRWVEEAEAQ